MSGDIAETIGELRELLSDMRHRAEQTGYGYFPGGDPRTFTPDPEICTEAEVAAWKADCARAERGKEPMTRTQCEAIKLGVDGLAIRTPTGYGVGTYAMTDDELIEDCERLERCIAQLTSWAEEET